LQSRTSRKVDKRLFVCDKCGQVWEEYMMFGRNKWTWEVYPKGHIPTIGKTRKLCPRHNKEKE